MHANTPEPTTLSTAIGDTWTRFWFTPADARPLAIVRILGASLALALWSSYGWDLEAWFGPEGIVSPQLLAQWRSPWAFSLFDAATTTGAVRAVHVAGIVALVALAVGLFTPIVSVLSAVLFASLLHRGPMLAGPADDVVAVVLWCLAIGRSGDAFSIDRLSAGRRGGAAAAPAARTRIALSLLQVHASAIAGAAVLSQLKADVWWDGTAAWWLAARGSRIIDLTSLFRGSEYLLNLVTHAITLFEIVFATGIWFGPLRRSLVPVALVAWPLVGLVAGEPFWGLAMAVLTLGCRPPTSSAR